MDKNIPKSKTVIGSFNQSSWDKHGISWFASIQPYTNNILIIDHSLNEKTKYFISLTESKIVQASKTSIEELDFILTLEKLNLDYFYYFAPTVWFQNITFPETHFSLSPECQNNDVFDDKINQIMQNITKKYGFSLSDQYISGTISDLKVFNMFTNYLLDTILKPIPGVLKIALNAYALYSCVNIDCKNHCFVNENTNILDNIIYNNNEVVNALNVLDDLPNDIKNNFSFSNRHKTIYNNWYAAYHSKISKSRIFKFQHPKYRIK